MEVLAEASSPNQPSFGESTSFSDRFRGFFVPPSDNNYTFYIQADDQAELYLSSNDSAAGKVRKIPIFVCITARVRSSYKLLQFASLAL